MSDGMKKVTDLTRGVYRLQYAGFVVGKRINRLTLEAEAWFWRVHAAADDFGNLAAEPSLLYMATIGRRADRVTLESVVAWVDEMIDVGLLTRYEAAGDAYLHVVGFERMQPAGKNGRRVRRVPSSPSEGGGNGPATRDGADEAGTSATAPGASGGTRARPGESGCVRVNPGESGCVSAPHSDTDTDAQSDTDAQQAAPVAGGASTAPGGASAEPPPPATAPDPVVMTFPCDGAAKTWELRESGVAKARARFPTLDVLAEFRAALAFVEDNPAKRKTATGMAGFLTRWLTTSQNDPRRRARPSEPIPAGPARRGFAPSEPVHAPNTATVAQTDADRERERQAAEAAAADRARVDKALAQCDALTLEQLKRDLMGELGEEGRVYARCDPRTSPSLRARIADLLARRAGGGNGKGGQAA